MTYTQRSATLQYTPHKLRPLIIIPQKLQRPEICLVYVTFFHHPKAKNFCMASFLARKKDSCHLESISFFRLLGSLPNNMLLPEIF